MHLNAMYTVSTFTFPMTITKVVTMLTAATRNALRSSRKNADRVALQKS